MGNGVIKFAPLNQKLRHQNSKPPTLRTLPTPPTLPTLPTSPPPHLPTSPRGDEIFHLMIVDS
ncbi:hypothetical protein [Fortiea contorta]|uniref:hypothetical protein n=1 Tax=Fortiea contorta TaxID=1892405 RepID=UPI00034A877E|nr:hypothetical protein [Fortiea contorta]